MTVLTRSDKISDQIHSDEFDIVLSTCARFPDRTIFYAQPAQPSFNEYNGPGIYYCHIVTGLSGSLYIYAVSDLIQGVSGFKADSVRIISKPIG